MAIIERIQDPTLAAMRASVEREASKEEKRTYLGASSLGEECGRKTWYALKGYDRKEKPYNNVAAIQDGHRTEDLIIQRLRTVEGVELWDKDENGNQYGFDWGFLKGHYDGVIRGLLQAPKTAHIFEVKTVNEKKFNQLQKAIDEYGEKNALQNWDPVYYAQAVLYMNAEQLTRHYLVCSTPGGRDQIGVRTDENTTYAKALIEKARRIYNMKEPPTRVGKKDFYKCKWCEFYSVCYSEN